MTSEQLAICVAQQSCMQCRGTGLHSKPSRLQKIVTIAITIKYNNVRYIFRPVGCSSKRKANCRGGSTAATGKIGRAPSQPWYRQYVIIPIVVEKLIYYNVYKKTLFRTRRTICAISGSRGAMGWVSGDSRGDSRKLLDNPACHPTYLLQMVWASGGLYTPAWLCHSTRLARLYT